MALNREVEPPATVARIALQSLAVGRKGLEDADPAVDIDDSGLVVRPQPAHDSVVTKRCDASVTVTFSVTRSTPLRNAGVWRGGAWPDDSTAGLLPARTMLARIVVDQARRMCRPSLANNQRADVTALGMLAQAGSSIHDAMAPLCQGRFTFG